MEQYKISVIIPTYNVEDYVDECVNSLIHQTFKDFEVIVVDDGSTDNTCYIFEKYKKYLPNLNVYRFQHRGAPGSSRNFGIKKAKGQFILFMDPDDTLPYDSLQVLYSSIAESKADFVMGNSCYFNSKKKWTQEDITKILFYNERITNIENEPGLFLNFTAWNKLYNTDFIRNNNIRFTENKRYGEDKEFVLRAYFLANKIHVIPNTIYNHRKRENQLNVSATQSFELEIFRQSIETIEICSEISKEFSKLDYFRKCFFQYRRIDFDFLRFIDYYMLNCFDDKRLIEEVRELSNKFFGILGDWKQLNLPFLQKAKLYYLNTNQLDELRDFIRLTKQNKLIYKLEVNGDSVFAKIVYPKNRFTLPEYVSNSNCEIKLVKSIEHMSYQNGYMNIKGWGYLNKIDCDKEKIKKYLVVKNQHGQKKEFLLDNKKRIDITVKKGLGIYNYNWSGFEGRIDITRILNSDINWKFGFEINLKIEIERVSIEEKITDFSMPKVSFNNGSQITEFITCILNNKNEPKKYKIYGNDRSFKENELTFVSENEIVQRTERITCTEKEIQLKGWALTPFIDTVSSYSVQKKIIFKNESTGQEYEYVTKNIKNVWPNNQFEINPFNFSYHYSGWEVSVPCLSLPDGIYEIYISIETAGVSARDKLKYPSNELLSKRLKLEQTYVTFNRRFTFIVSGSEFIRENITFKLHIQSLNNSYEQIQGGYLPIIGYKSNYWFINEEPHIMLKKIAVGYDSLTFSGTAILSYNNSPMVQKQLIIENKNNGEVYLYPCSNYMFDFGDEKNKFAGWSATIPYSKLRDGQYIIKLRLISGNIIKDEPISLMYSFLLRNHEVWGQAHYIKHLKLNFSVNKIITTQNKYSFSFEANRSNKNLLEGIFVKSRRKIYKFINKNISKIKKAAKLNSPIINKLRRLIPVNLGTIKRKYINKIKNKVYILTYDICKLMPINRKKIVFATYKSNLVGNLMYIYNEIIERNLDKKCVCLYGNEKSFAELLRTAYHLATASTVFVEDYYRHLYHLRHRKQTKFIQTWHATGVFKRFGMLAIDKKETLGEEFEKKAHAYYTHVLVSGTKMVKPYAEAFNISEDKVYPIGIPRTDIFFDQVKIKKKKDYVYRLYPQILNKKVILYAPTFRGDYKRRKTFRNELDFEVMKPLFDNGFILLYKTHPNVIEPITIPDKFKDFIYDVSLYPDINDLFFVTDILITDYSTTIFEFALLNKPIIAYAYDLNTYMDERGFYYDYDFIIPGPIFKTTEDIVEYILNLKGFYVDHSKFIEHFMDRIDGKSTKRAVELILK